MYIDNESTAKGVKKSNDVEAVSSPASEKVKHKRSTLGDEDLELDYLDDDIVTDDVIEEGSTLLYGDLDFADDEQTNPNLRNEKSPTTTKNESDECEEGEIRDNELFTTTTVVKKSPPPTEATDDPTTTMDDDTEIDDAIDNAMNIEGLLVDGATDIDTQEAVDTPDDSSVDSNR